MEQRPELTAQFPAIDGIAKPDRNHRRGEDCMDNPVTWYDLAEDPIRKDVLKIIMLPDHEFESWYLARHNAIRAILTPYELVSSIPNLSNGAHTSVFGSYTVFRETAETLRKAKDHLKLLKKRRAEIKNIPECLYSGEVGW